MKSRRLLSLTILLLVCISSFSQGDDERKWALDFQLGGAIPTKSTTEVINKNSSSDVVVPSNRSGLMTKLHLEYYIPDKPFSVKAGYEHEEINFIGGDIESDLNQLMLGGRCYLGNSDCVILPYLGLDTYWNVGSRYSDVDMFFSSANSIDNYTRKGYVRQPFFSVAPVVGADIYLLPCLAFQVEYGFRIGIDSKVSVDTKYVSQNMEYHTKSYFNRSALTIGLKLTFPIDFNSKNGLINEIMGKM